MTLKSQASKELRELLHGAFVLADVLSPLLNGVEFADFPILVAKLRDPFVRQRLASAVKDVHLIGSQIGDITINELLEIAEEFSSASDG